jgi:hypothetical protein
MEAGGSWSADPAGSGALRWWNGNQWTAYVARRRQRRRLLRSIGMLACAVIFVLGASSLAWGAFGRFRHVTVSPTTAVVVAPLTAHDCNNGDELLVSISWHGQAVRTSDPGPSCATEYLPGQRLTVYVGSDSPGDVGPDPNWILNPDTHDPFAVFGPNDEREFLVLVGSLFVICACGAGVTLSGGIRRSSPWVVEWRP